MRRIALFFFSLLAFTSAFTQDKAFICPGSGTGQHTSHDKIITRFDPPAGYQHVAATQTSFAAWLQNLPVKLACTRVKTYAGDYAFTDVYTAAVIDMDIGNRDLQRCAGAVIRLRAEYLFIQKRFNDIAFHFNSGFLCDFVHYANGFRCCDERWVLQGEKNYSHENFLTYLEFVFANASMASLVKDLKPVISPANMKAGDVFIKDSAPAHCFIVMDVAENKKHEKRFLLAQGFVPAQEIQVVQYDGNEWFGLDKRSDILYGELIDPRFLMRFGD